MGVWWVYFFCLMVGNGRRERDGRGGMVGDTIRDETVRQGQQDRMLRVGTGWDGGIGWDGWHGWHGMEWNGRGASVCVLVYMRRDETSGT